MGGYTFRNVQAEDRSLLDGWLRTPEPSRWWGEADAQLALILEDLTDDAMRQWIVSFQDRPFAYVQAYEVHTWPQPHLAPLPHGTMAIDAFIGVPKMIGQGHGTKFLRLLAEHLMAEGAPLVAIDPAPDNERARGAYRKAGFRDHGRVETASGPAMLMTFAGS